MVDYSQHGEQQFIADYFGDTIGCCLSVGENDGVTFSNTKALIDKGWSATLVEPCTAPYAKLKRLHRENKLVDCINVAVGAKTGLTKIYESGTLLGKDDTSLVSTIKPTEIARWRTAGEGQRVVEFVQTEVMMGDFASLLAWSKYKQFDFISIDIEGAELDVLPQMDLVALGCKLMIVEVNFKPQELFDNIILPQGYKVVGRDKVNVYYGRE